MSEEEGTREHRCVTSTPVEAGRYRERRPVKVTLPVSLPELTPEVARILLEILVELSQDNGVTRKRHGEGSS
jgi:hypothetical protein